jgi:hypothetical protein
MIACENRALSECIRDRCKRTGGGKVLWISEKFKSSANLFSGALAVILLQALMHEFARISQVIIHGAIQSRKLSDPSSK